MDANFYRKDKAFLSREFSSKEEFSKNIKSLYNDEEKIKHLYFQLLFKLKKSVVEGNIKDINNTNTLLSYLNNVQDYSKLKYSDSDDNPLKNTNLLILACKHNKVETLKYILNNFNAFRNLHSNNEIFLYGKDETHHNAFYYAIRSNNVNLLETLINEWPGGSEKSDELDEILSSAYEEINLKNISLSEETKLFIENNVINFRFFSKSSGKIKSNRVPLKNIKERIALVIENIESLNSITQLNDKFIFVAKSIARNISVLKRQLKLTYDTLPWEEIEFCLISFISFCVNSQEINLFYQMALNRDNILRYLIDFSDILVKLKDNIESFDINKLSILPNKTRESIIFEIVKKNPQFKDLYNVHQQIRDIHSLMKMNSYVKLLSSVDPAQKEGQIIILRCLQVIGEYLKNTLESPKLSNFTSELLLDSLPTDSRKIIIDLRNSLSHAYSLSRRLEIEEGASIKFFTGVLKDVENIGNIINGILFDNKVKKIRILVESIMNTKNSDEIKEISFKLKNIDISMDSIINKGNLKTTSQNRISQLIEELRTNTPKRTSSENNILIKMERMISVKEEQIMAIDFNYDAVIGKIKALKYKIDTTKLDKNTLRGLKYRASTILENLKDCEIKSDILLELGDLLLEFFVSYTSNIKNDFKNIRKIMNKMLFIFDFESDNVQWVDQLREKLMQKFTAHKNNHNLSYKHKKEFYQDQLEKKIAQLQNILNINMPNSQLKGSSYSCSAQVHVVLELLILDILSILDHLKNRLDNNTYFLDKSTPVLIGKCLRNHLAHDNTLNDIFIRDIQSILISNARKLMVDDVLKSNIMIGKVIEDNPYEIKKIYNQNLSIISSQERMFSALEEGNLECLEECILNGADINGRNIASWSALHYAAKSHSLEIVKFVCARVTNAKLTDENELNAMHIAAMYGNSKAVEFFIKEIDLTVNDVDDMGRTALHIAAKNGHKCVVDILLKYQANVNTKDIPGYSALHYAVEHNHKEIVKTLVERHKNVDINEMIGGFTSLHVAAERGHGDLVSYFLDHGANIHAKTDTNVTPLHLAALNGYLDVVNILILKGSNVNARVIDGCTPLHYAVENGHEDITEILLKHGGNPNYFDETFKNTPLHYATKDGHTRIVKTLLKHKAKVNVTTINNITPVVFAIGSGHVEIVDILLKNGAEININKNEMLCTAIYNGHIKVVDYLIKLKINVNTKDEDGMTPMHVAASGDNEDIINLLIKNNAQVNIRDIFGKTPLFIAAGKGNTNILEILLKHKAEVNIKENDGKSPIHYAAAHSSSSVELLIKYDANVNVKDTNGTTALHVATVNNKKDVIKLLLKNGIDVNAQHFQDITALHIAIKKSYKDIVELLITNKADIDIKTKNNLTPLCLAAMSSNKEIVQMLIANKTYIDDVRPLCFAITSNNKHIVKVLLQKKAPINVYFEGFSPLHLAIQKGNEDISNILISEGADVNFELANGATPLYLAASLGHEEIITNLINNGAGLSSKNDEGLSPLHIAAREGYINIVECLINCGVNVDIKDKKNRTALEFAVALGHLQVVQTLLKYKKTDINNKGNDDFTLLHIAAQLGHLEVVKYLIDNGADVKAKNDSGSKPIHIAAREGHTEVVEAFLSSGSHIDELGLAHQTLLHYAAISGQSKMAEYLIEKGVDINSRDRNLQTPLHIAAAEGHLDCIIVLLKNGAFYNASDILQRKPVVMSRDKTIGNLLSSIEMLFKAVKQNQSLEVKNCVLAGAIVNAKNVDNVTSLHHAAWKGFEEIINILLKNKADPNILGKKGLTALHYATKFSHVAITKTLLASGAIFNIVSESEKTPLDLAEDKNIVSLLKLINDCFEKVKANNSIVVKNLKKIKDTSTMKAIMGACNNNNQTLIAVAMKNHFSEVKYLCGVMQTDLSKNLKNANLLLVEEKYEAALAIFKKIIAQRKEILGVNNPGNLDIGEEIASILYKQQKYEEALSQLEKISESYKDILGENSPNTLRTRSKIALILHRQGKNEEALTIYRDVLKQQKKILKEDDLDILDTQIHMSLVLDGLHQYREALNINSEVLEKQKKKLGAFHPKTLITQNNIAMVLNNQGKHDEALQIYWEVHKARKIVLGPNHSLTFKALHNVASVLSIQNKQNEAFEIYKGILEQQKAVLGPHHIDTLNTQENIARLLYQQGKYANALKFFNESFERKKNLVGQDHPEIKRSQMIIDMINMRFKMNNNYDVVDIIKNRNNDMKIAVSNGDVDKVQYLIESEVDVNAKDDDGRTLLHYAVDNGHVKIINMLLRSGSMVHTVTNKGNTPLHTAVSKDSLNIVELLIKSVNSKQLSCFINAKTNGGGTTSLHVAAQNGCLEIVKLLLRNGATFDIKNKQGKTPLDLSTDKAIIEILGRIDELFKNNTENTASIIKKLEVLKPDEFKAITGTRNVKGKSFIQIAIINNNQELAKKILSKLQKLD